MASVPFALSDLAREVTEEILADMRKGFYQGRAYRHDPIVWDISDGWCEDWGELLIKRWHLEHQDILPENHSCDQECPQADWYEKEYYEDNYVVQHYVIIFQGKYYDAETPDGVADVWELPIWRQEERPAK